MNKTETVKQYIDWAADHFNAGKPDMADDCIRAAKRILDCHVIVPRAATEAMLKAGTTHALNTSISSQTGGWPAYIAGQWSAMVKASE